MVIKQISSAFLAIALVLACSSCGKDDDSQPQPVNAARQEMNISYGSHTRQKMDVYFPEGWTNETPVVFVLHGVGFVAGSKEDFTDRALLFRNEGFITVNLSYRLVDTAGLLQNPPVHQPSAIKVRDVVQDVDAAVEKYKALAPGWGSGSARMYMAGHSAGAILAMLYVQWDANDDGDVRASGNWAGITDLSLPSDTVWNQYDPQFVVLYKELYYRFTGYEATVANNLAYMAISPYWVTNNNAGRPNISVMPEDNDVFGTEEPNEGSHQQVATYHALLTSRGVPNENILIAGEDHGFSAKPGSWTTVVRQTAAFFRSH